MSLRSLDAIEKYDINIDELPEDAQTGISNIEEILRGFHALDSRGLEPKPQTVKKLMAIDKWVYNEIIDFVEGTDDNSSNAPYSSEDLVDEVHEQLAEGGSDENAPDPKEVKIGDAIEAELKSLYDAQKTSMTIEELAKVAKTTYGVLFDIYEEGEDNGVKTTNYAVYERDGQVKITKN